MPGVVFLRVDGAVRSFCNDSLHIITGEIILIPAGSPLLQHGSIFGKRLGMGVVVIAMRLPPKLALLKQKSRIGVMGSFVVSIKANEVSRSRNSSTILRAETAKHLT